MEMLLIDDEGYIHRIIERFLERFGNEKGMDVHLKSVPDPVQGVLELSMAGEYFDVVAMDARLPDHNLHVLDKPFHYRQFARSLMEMVVRDSSRECVRIRSMQR